MPCHSALIRHHAYAQGAAPVVRAQAAPGTVAEVKQIVSSIEFDAPPPVTNDEINKVRSSSRPSAASRALPRTARASNARTPARKG